MPKRTKKKSVSVTMGEPVTTELVEGVEITITPITIRSETAITVYEAVIESKVKGEEFVLSRLFESRSALKGFLRGMDVTGTLIAGKPMRLADLPHPALDE